MATRLPIFLLSSALAACGGTTSSVNQYVIQSHPGVGTSQPSGELYFVANVNNTEDNSIRPHGCFSVSGFSPEWGTEYVITVNEKSIPPLVADACDTEKTLISIDGQAQDPIGTQYPNAMGSHSGGLVISRDADEPGQFRLHGYSKPIYCEESVCGPIVDEDSGMLFSDVVFELMEIEEQRIIGILPR